MSVSTKNYTVQELLLYFPPELHELIHKRCEMLYRVQGDAPDLLRGLGGTYGLADNLCSHLKAIPGIGHARARHLIYGRSSGMNVGLNNYWVQTWIQTVQRLIDEPESFLASDLQRYGLPTLGGYNGTFTRESLRHLCALVYSWREAA